MPIHQAECQPYAKGAYGDDTFFNAIKVLHLHRVELYSNNCHPFEIVPIPSIVDDKITIKIILGIFGAECVPSERYVYLEDFFFADRCRSNDMSLFLDLAELVGMETIIVKRHPRDDANRYAPYGCKEFPTSVVPWEVQMLDGDYSRKVLLSVSSTSLLTPSLIFDYPYHVISLEKMFRGSNPTHNDAMFKSFMQKFSSFANKDVVRFHTPANKEELRDAIAYLNLIHN